MNTSSFHQYIPICEVIITFIAACLIIPQLIIMKKQLTKHHEERRRENTIHFMLMWCNSLKKDTCIAEQVARKFNSEQCKNLYNHSAFSVADDVKKDICKFCPLTRDICNACDTCSLKESNTLDGKILTELRWHVITYLNTLETIMIAWKLAIVDKETIEEQFKFLMDPEKGTTLTQFRATAGGYPTIDSFINVLKNTTTTTKHKL